MREEGWEPWRSELKIGCSLIFFPLAHWKIRTIPPFIHVLNTLLRRSTWSISFTLYSNTISRYCSTGSQTWRLRLSEFKISALPGDISIKCQSPDWTQVSLFPRVEPLVTVLNLDSPSFYWILLFFLLRSFMPFSSLFIQTMGDIMYIPKLYIVKRILNYFTGMSSPILT